MMVEGGTIHKWTPALRDLHHRGQDRPQRYRGFQCRLAAADGYQQWFSGYYNDEVIFTLNKDETKTKKPPDGELTG